MARVNNATANRRSCKIVLLSGMLGAAYALTPIAVSGAPESQGVQITYIVQVVTETTPTSDPHCPLKVVIQGAGLTDLLGPVHDEQSHCIQSDGTIDQGVFTLTGGTLASGLPGGDDSGDSISGQYRAHAVPTFASQLTNPPGGSWLLYGEVCTWKGTGKFAGVINDCPTATGPGRFVPARGIANFTTNEGTVYGTMVLRFRDAE